jgi:hypothetical protein
MADELNPESLSIEETAYSDLARGRILLEAQIKRLMSSLDRRKNQTFDPVMLRAAQGFLAPTKNGSFGESLGNVAGGVAEEQAKQQLQDEQVGKMQLELGQKLYDLKRQSAAQEMLGSSLGGKKPTIAQAPMATAPTTSAPIGGTPLPVGQAQTSQTNQVPTDVQQAVSAIKQNPNIMDELTMTPQIVAAISTLDPALGKIAESVLNSQMKKIEIMQKRYNTNAQGDVFDTFTGEMIKKGARTVEVNSPYDPDPDRAIKMPADLVDQYNQLDFSNNKAVNTWLKQHGLGAYAIGAEGAPTGETVSLGAPTAKTKSEKDLENKITEKREGAKIDEDVKQKKALQDAADASMEVKNSARTIYNYAENPKTTNTFGILSKPGIGPAILSAIESGVTVGNYNVGISALPDIIRKAKGSQDDINAALAVAPKLAQLELGYRRMFLQGQGSVSNMEGQVVAKLGPTMADTPKIVMLKSEMITARATFDEQNSNRYQKWLEKNPNGYVEQYKHSPSYVELQNHYENKMKQLDKKYL